LAFSFWECSSSFLFRFNEVIFFGQEKDDENGRGKGRSWGEIVVVGS
jgi:hypothetical protein